MTATLAELLAAGHAGWEACLDHLADAIGGRVYAAHPAEFELVRWAVRGEPRTRADFGKPHPDDFPGRGAA